MVASGLGEKPWPVFHSTHLGVISSKVNPANAGVGQCTCAHGAGLQRHIKVASAQTFRPQHLCRFTQHQHFCVGGWIFQFQRAVASAGQNCARLIHHTSAYGHFAPRGSCFRFFQRSGHWFWEFERHVLAFATCQLAVPAPTRRPMRIVAGRFKGREIFGPTSLATRPTSDRVRESLFNILAHGLEGFVLEDARVMDLFAGTGALGLEALSRGAKFCQFVEESAEARGVIRKNADACGAIGQCKIWRRDATDLGPSAPQSPFNLVFADPPYNKGLGEKALHSLLVGGWLVPGAIVVLEEAEKAVVADVAGFTLIDQRIYGDTQVRIYRAA
jgi:16S rRNA (guanine966-N2)-methyltransferase